MSNTVIQLKYSSLNATPTTLQPGEPAYSFVSGNLFIGDASNNPIVIGGDHYISIIDGATSTNTINQIVKRDASGNFSAGVITARLAGNADTASALQAARNFSITGDITAPAISFDGTGAVALVSNLANTGVTAGTYGNTSTIPVLTVDAKGRVTSVTNTSIATTLAVAGDTGTDSIALGTDTLNIMGRDGIVTQVTSGNNSVLIDVDNTVIRTTGNQTINGDLTIGGDLIVSGNTISIDVTSMNISDPLMYLAGNNYTSDLVDIGFVGNYYDGASQRHAGLARHAADGKFYIFTNYTPEPDNNIIDVTDASFRRANLVANIIDGTISNLASDLAVADGGTGASSFTNGQMLIGQGTSALTTIANVTAVSATVAAANTLNSFTTDVYGRVTAFTQQQIAIDVDQITSGVLPINRGGTNQTSFASNRRVYFDGTSLSSLANVTQTITGGLATSNTITSIAFDPMSGGVTAYTGAKIAIDASQVTSGTLGVTRGGTGLASYAVGDLVYASGTTTLASLSDVATGNVLLSGGVSTAPIWGKIGLTTHVTGTLAVSNGGTGNTSLQTNAVLIGQGTSAVTTVASSTEGHILQINASGIPTFGMLSGGTF